MHADTSDTTLRDPWTVFALGKDQHVSFPITTFSNVDDALGHAKTLFEEGAFEVSIQRAY